MDSDRWIASLNLSRCILGFDQICAPRHFGCAPRPRPGRAFSAPRPLRPRAPAYPGHFQTPWAGSSTGPLPLPARRQRAFLMAAAESRAAGLGAAGGRERPARRGPERIRGCRRSRHVHGQGEHRARPPPRSGLARASVLRLNLLLSESQCYIPRRSDLRRLTEIGKACTGELGRA